MTRLAFLLLFTPWFGACAAIGGARPPGPSHSAEARALLLDLEGISGRRILSGQHEYPGELRRHMARTRELAGGAHPAVWGSDFGFTAGGKDGVVHRQAVVDEAIRQWDQGSLVTLMWHACRPVDEEPCGWKESVQADLSEEEWNDLLTPGTTVHERWKAQVDVVASYLKQLQAKRVPVLWRPYHEMNGGWFWWGHKRGERGYAALWRMLHERLHGVHGLDNLVWVWNANAPHSSAEPYASYHPGAAFVDILAADVYGGDFRQSHHDELKALAAGKVIALGEVGRVPSPEVLAAQPHWAWFMIWAGFQDGENTPEAIRALFGAERVLNLGEFDRPARAVPRDAGRERRTSNPRTP